ncbi:MAG: VTT domain-containing protein [Kiritimatiellae bacterium]|nr:VTT domain-containing protein [Kiritimatiellia bacterium]
MKTTLLVFLVALAVILPFCIWGEAIDAWFVAMANADTSTRGLLGTLLFSALALDIFLPVPSSLASTLCGTFFGWIGGFLLSFGAMTVSCFLGWAIGHLATPLAKRFIGENDLPKLQALLTRYGILILLALRTVPVLAEASVLLAGIARVPFRACMPLLLLGNAIVSLAYVYAGVYGKNAENMLPAFLGSLTLSGLLMLTTFWLRRTRPTVSP